MEKIKLPRSSYDEVSRIITTYGAIGKPCGLNDIVQASGVHKTVVSANNAFLASIEIIEGGNKKSITSKGASLARALEHQMESEKQVAWKEIIDENDFLTKMVQAVKIRRGMEIGQFENHIAFSSGETKSTGVRTGAKTVVDIFLDSGVLSKEGDKIVFSGESSINMISKVELPNSENLDTKIVIPEQSKLEIPTIQTKSGITLNIELSIQASPNELDGLGEKIKKIIDEISKEN